MKNRRDLLQRFMNDNFDLSCFTIEWDDDFMVNLTDRYQSTLTLICVEDNLICTAIDGVKYLSYRLDRDLLDKECWLVYSKKEENDDDEE